MSQRGKEEQLVDPETLSVQKLKELMRNEGIDVDRDPECQAIRDKDELVLLLRHRVPKYAKFDVHHKGDEYAQGMGSEQKQQIEEHFAHEPHYNAPDPKK